MASKFPADQYCPNCRSCDTNCSFAGVWAVAPRACASACRTSITVPALLIAGDRDVVLAFRGMDQVVANLPKNVPKLQKTLILPGCGHWTQQERPQEVNEAMIEFLRRL